MELLALWDRAAKELPAKAMGVAVLCLGDAPIGRGDPREPPAGAELGMGRFQDGAVEQAFQLRTASSGLSAVGLLLNAGSGQRCPSAVRPRRTYGSGLTGGGLAVQPTASEPRCKGLDQPLT